MNPSKEFYQLLNQSIEPTKNDKYVRETTTMMKSLLLTRKKPTKALILGAGTMRDLSIDFFLREFAQVTITDIDDTWMNQVMSSSTRKSQVILKQMDYLGIDETEFFNDFDELLTWQEEKEFIASMLQEKLKRLKNYEFSNYLSDTYDLIYVSPIYTQLLYVQVEQTLKAMQKKGLNEQTKDFVLSYILQEMTSLIDHFNKEVFKLLKDSGLVFVGSDIFSLSDNSFSRKILAGIGSKEVMDELYLDYQETYGYGLGDYGLYSMEELLKKVRSRWFLWNQSKHQTYVVNFCAFEKIENTLGG